MRVMRDLVGEILSDRYRVISRVAGGGMGEVYRAHDLLLDRTVAVKILQPTLAADPDLVHRFRAEARAVARLNHPNIVSVHDWGSQDERTYYMVMEYVSGSDLRDVLVDNGALAPAHAVEIAAYVCDALGAAHNLGVVHRDIKPENVLIGRGGAVKVVDFGIAAVADAERTSPGNAMSGTLRYVSPEQAAGDQATPFSDVWAAGAILTEMLTGRPPQGNGPEALRRRMGETPTPPSDRVPGLPPELDSIVMKACALDPPDRYDGAGEMAAALRRVRDRNLPDAGPLSDLLFEATSEVRLADIEATTESRSLERKRRAHGRRRSAIAKGLAVIAAFILLAAGVAKAVQALGGPSMVDVPKVVGETQKQAGHRLDLAGLNMTVGSRHHSLSAPAGEVIRQSPAKGQSKEGSKVMVVVSMGLPQRSVPPLAGTTQPTAQQRLKAADLKLGSIQRRYSLHPAGTIVSQSPADGRVDYGTNVDVVISLGPRPVAVPDVTGMSKTKAVKQLEKAGFKTSISQDYSNSVAKGDVISTSPAASTTSTQGSAIDLVLSKGPRYTTLKMPDVRGLPLDQAKSKLESLALRPTVRNCGGGTVVVDTDPIAGSTVRQNDIVALFVCG